MAQAVYDRIGTGYAAQRRPDSRIAARIEKALGDAATVVNVDAGAGSYEPSGRKVVAVEPSATMIAQRAPGAAPAVMARAESLPFDEDSFDAAMAILTVHHWNDKAGGLCEMRRVAQRTVVILTYDPAHPGCWLNEYFPALRTLDEEQMPPIGFYEQVLGPVDITSVPVSADCSDGFLYAFWRRPEAYLDPDVRSGSSSFWKIPGIESGLARLDGDLASGEWHRRNGHVLELPELDLGYRLVHFRH